MYKTTKKVVSIILCVLMLCCAFPTAAFAADANGTYYVAGNDAAVFGEIWSANYTKNKMTKENGKFTKTYNNVAAGSYLFKVTDGTWDHSWGASNGGNYELTVYENNSNITIIFDPDTDTISVTGYGCPYVIVGDLDLCTSAWDPTDNNNRMTEENGICTKTYYDVPSGDHSFKITQGNWDSPSWGYNGDNFNFTLSDSCDVTITFNDQTKEINVSGDNISVINGVQYCTTKEEMQSEHPYNNSSSKTWKYTSPNATALSFTFSEETETYYYDPIQIFDNNNEQIGYDFRGKDLAGKTFVVKGNSFSIKLSGSSSNCYGFSLSDITVNPTFTENDYNLLYLPDDNYNSDNYTIKLNYWNVYEKWQTIPMKKSAYLINGKPAYCATVTEDFDLAYTIQFQVYEGDLWKDQTELQNVKYSDYDGCIVFSDDREKAALVDVNYNGLTGYAIGDEVTITGYNGDATELVIPEKIEGKTVTGIVEGALENNDELEKITVPATVTYIGEDAFPDVEIHGLKRAYIYTYCKEMDYEFVDDTIAATDVALNGDYGDTITLETGDTMDLDFAITPANSTDLLTVTSNNDCVSIDGNKLKANWSGEATVTAEATSGVQCTFTVNVIYVNEFTVSKLPDKLVYTKGEELDTTGLKATVSFSNWTSKETTDFTVSGYDKTKTGMQTVTLTYTAKNDQEYSDSYLVEVKEAKGRPIGIEIKKYPETLQYKKSSTTSLDTDLELELVYDSGEKEAVENYTVDDSAFDIKSVGTYGITVTAEGFSTSYKVKVYRRNPDDEDPAQPESPFKTFYYIDSNGNNCKNIIVALSSGDGTVNQYMEKTSDKYQGSNIYKLTYDAEKFTTVKLFNYSSSYDKTAIYDGYGYGHIKEFGNDVQNGKYYLPDKDIWINSINGTATVYLVNTSGWSSPKAYVWRDPSLALKQWPGEEMTPTNYYYDNHRVYSYTFDTAIYNKIIFNGSNADGGMEQTENLDVQPGKYFFNNENLWEDNRPALSVDTDNEMTKELTPDADDENIEKFGFKSDITYSGAELLGVQKKKNAERSMRFVSAVSSDILNASNVENYGYVLTKISLPSSEVKSQMNKLTVDNGRVFNCKDSGNTISGKYGTDEAATRYKYITMAVNNVPEGNGIAARFFIKTTDGEYHYAKYTDKNGNKFDGCVAHISDLTD